MSVRRARCKCGRIVIANDARKTVSHEAPECDWFKGLVSFAMGPSTRAVEVLDVDTGERFGPAGGDA